MGSTAVLVVENDPRVARAEGDVLQAAAYDVAVEHFARTGLDRLRHNAADVIILSGNLPDMTPGEFIAALAKQELVLPVLLVSDPDEAPWAANLREGWVMDSIVRDAQNRFLQTLPNTVRDVVAAHNRALRRRIQASTGLCSRAFEISSDPAYLWQRTDDGQLVLTQANTAAEVLAGQTTGEILGSPAESFFQNDPQIANRIRQTLKTGTPWNEERHVRSKVLGLGRWYTIRYIRTSKRQVLVITNDITQSKLTEDHLRESEVKYRTLFSTETDALLIYDVKAGRFVDTNPAASRIYGYSQEEFFRMGVGDISNEPEAATERVQQLLSQANNTLRHRHHVKKDGTVFPVEISFCQFQWSNHRMLCALVRDITQRKQTEKALIRAERVAAIGTLASGVAHEYNNVHQAIIGWLELAIRDKSLPKVIRSKLENAHSAAWRGAEITKNLLAFSRKTKSDKWSATSLNKVVKDTLKIVEHEYASEGVDLELRLTPVPPVLMDPAQIGQVVMNLVINAHHALLGRAEKHLIVETGRLNGSVFVRITDTGGGIPESEKPHLFEPFFSTKGEYAPAGSPCARIKGTGLGLSVSNTIVDNHDGRLAVESTLGVGSTFTLWLPVTTSTHSESEPNAEAPLTTPSPPKSRVMVLDDEKEVREVLSDMLTAQGHETVALENADVGMQMLKERPFDLAIIDLQMPQVNGIDFIRAMSTMPPASRPVCLVVTGKLPNDVAEECNDLAVFDTLVKPIDFRQLNERVAAALLSRPHPKADATGEEAI